MKNFSFLEKLFIQNQYDNSVCYNINDFSYILEEIKSLFYREKKIEKDCTSLYDMLSLINKYNYKYKSLTDNYTEIFSTIIKKIYPHSTLYIEDYDFNTKILNINFKNYNNQENIFISVNDNDKFNILNNNCKYSTLILGYIYKYLPKLYYELEKFKDFKTQHSYVLKSANSNFNIDIDSHSIKVYYINVINNMFTDFEIKKDIFKNKFSYNCNLPEILDIISGREKELFDKVLIQINDCPEWSKDLLQNSSEQQNFKVKKIERK
jgi:hypothetical protein